MPGQRWTVTMPEDTDSGPFTIQPGSRLRGDLSIYIEDMAERDLEAATLKDQPAGKSAGLIVVHIAGHGGDRRKNGIVVHADGVSILNLSAHNFTENALYWDGADRFRASYVTVWNVGEYGIYVEDGEHGRVDHTYVSGAARAAYYVG